MTEWKKPLTAEKIYRMVMAVLYGMLIWNPVQREVIFEGKPMWQWAILFAGLLFFVCFDFCGLRGRISLGLSVVILAVIGQWRRAGDSQTLREIAILLGVSAVAYGLAILLQRIHILKLILAAAAVVILLYQCFVGIEVSHFEVCLFLLFVFVSVAEVIERHWHKKKFHSIECYMIWSMPIVVLYLLLLLATPVSAKPYDWAFVKEMYVSLSEALTTLVQDVRRGNTDDFESAKTGFSENGRLFGKITDETKKLMTISGTYGLITNVYLTGKVYDTFDGSGWIQAETELSGERFFDALETAYAVELYDGENAADYIRGTKLSVEYSYFNSQCLFAPLKTYYLQNIEYGEDGANLKLPKISGYGTAYGAGFFQINVNHPLFYEFTENIGDDDEATWNAVVKRYIPKDKKLYSFEGLQKHRQQIAEVYLPETTISPQIEEYLAKTLAEAETDLEKAIAIESSLREMEYTKMPGVYPDEIKDAEGFLDYFMLENRKGYCSYFATAFVLLARAEGIPARYVEGFCVPTISGKRMEITSNMAHAWPEIYLEGVGWIPFEPTPGYEEVRYTPWEKGAQTKGNAAWAAEAEEIEQETEMEKADEDIEEIDTSMRTKKNGLVIVTFSIFMGSVLGCLLIDMMWRKIRYRKLSAEEKFVWQVRKNLWLLERRGFKRKQEETYEEYGKRLEVSYLFLELYEAVLYGQKKMNMEALGLVVKEQEEILLLLKKERRLLYIWARMQTMV